MIEIKGKRTIHGKSVSLEKSMIGSIFIEREITKRFVIIFVDSFLKKSNTKETIIRTSRLIKKILY